MPNKLEESNGQHSLPSTDLNLCFLHNVNISGPPRPQIFPSQNKRAQSKLRELWTAIFWWVSPDLREFARTSQTGFILLSLAEIFQGFLQHSHQCSRTGLRIEEMYALLPPLLFGFHKDQIIWDLALDAAISHAQTDVLACFCSHTISLHGLYNLKDPR